MNDDRMTPEALAEIEGKAKKCADNKLPALALIFSTERELALDAVPQMAAEIRRLQERLNAAENDIRQAAPCFACNHFWGNGGGCFGAGICRTKDIVITPCEEPNTFCATIPDDGRDTFDWRGVCAENGGGHE